MAFVHVSVFSSHVSPVRDKDFADRLFSFARRTVAAAGSKDAEDGLFAAKRLKSGCLPDIQCCQSSIFRELRQRELMQAESVVASRGETSARRATGLKARIGMLFNVH